jgi:putative sterol carrier protein
MGARVAKISALGSPVMNVVLHFTASGESIGMPDQINEVELDVTMHGLGHIVVLTYVPTAAVRARQRIYSTPIDESRTDILGVVNTLRLPDAEFTRTLADLFFHAFTHDFVRDFPIWENKSFLESPLLSAADGPIIYYRRWAAQFYVNAPSPAPECHAESSAGDPGSPLLPLFGRALTSLRTAMTGGLSSIRRKPSSAPATTSRPEHAAAPRSPAADPPAEPPLPASVSWRVDSVTEYFDTLDRRFVPAASQGMDAVFQWEIHGTGGGTYHVTVTGGKMTLGRGSHEKPTVTITMKDTDYVKMVNGEIDGALAFVTGKGKVSGSIPMAMKMQSIFPAVKRA